MNFRILYGIHTLMPLPPPLLLLLHCDAVPMLQTRTLCGYPSALPSVSQPSATGLTVCWSSSREELKFSEIWVKEQGELKQNERRGDDSSFHSTTMDDVVANGVLVARVPVRPSQAYTSVGPIKLLVALLLMSMHRSCFLYQQPAG